LIKVSWTTSSASALQRRILIAIECSTGWYNSMVFDGFKAQLN
jgi:hypothetical protein